MDQFASHLIAAVLVLCCTVPGLAQGTLSYKEASNGLQVPRLESGRSEIEFGDLNGDGNVDIVSIGDHGSPNIGTKEHGVMVWFGDGLGNWSVFQNGNFGYGGVALGDVNNDGLMDVGYGMHHNYSTNHFGDRLEGVALGDGTGKKWRPWDRGVASNGETYGMFGADFADINNDGFLDYGSESFGCCAGAHVYVNNGNGTWTQSFGFLGGNGMDDFVFADFMGDGNADFADANSKGTVFLGDGTGAFTLADGNLPHVPSGGRAGISVGDVNDDGREDLAFVNGSGGLEVWSMVSNAVWQNLSGSLPGSGRFEATQIADMNLDGHGDIVSFGHGRVSVYTGDGLGNWTLAAAFSTPGRQGYAAFRAGADVDHNGFPDIGIMAAESGGINHLRVYAESTTASQPRIYPKAGRQGRVLVPGSVRRLEWTATVPRGQDPARVSLELSVEGASGPWQTIAENLPNNGTYQWQVPKGLQGASECYVRFRLLIGGVESASAVTLHPFMLRVNH